MSEIERESSQRASESDTSPPPHWCPGCGGTFDARTRALIPPTTADVVSTRCPMCTEAKSWDDLDESSLSLDRPLERPASRASSTSIDDVLGIHAVDALLEVELGIRSRGEGDLRREAVVVDDDGDEGDDDLLDVDDDDDDAFARTTRALLIRIDGVLHAIWFGNRFGVSAGPCLVARVDSPWWPFRRDGVVAQLAIASPGQVTMCNFFRRPPSDDAQDVLVAVAEAGPAADAVVIEVGLAWASRDEFSRVMHPLQSGSSIEVGTRVRVSCRPQQGIRFARIVIGDAERWFVEDIRIGERSILAGGGLPGGVFSPAAIGATMAPIAIRAGVEVSIDVSRVSDDAGPLPFRATVIGDRLEPVKRRYLQFYSRLTPEGRREPWLLDPTTDPVADGGAS